jgi:hypothetical protein
MSARTNRTDGPTFGVIVHPHVVGPDTTVGIGRDEALNEIQTTAALSQAAP